MDPLTEFEDLLDDFEFIHTNKKEEVMNVACAFDIETTSFYRPLDDNSRALVNPPEDVKDRFWEKSSCMYAFVFGVNGKTIIGRTWDEALSFFERFSEHYKLSEHRRAIFYIHNLSFEFQFIKDRFGWEKVFAMDDRKPLRALTTLGIEFRCSYLLTGYSLETVGKHLHKYKVEKKKGDLDYSKLRHSKTPLSKKEIGYIVNDGLVVMAHIQEEIERLGDITKLPLTKTGYVRRYCMNECLYEGSHIHNVEKFKNYRMRMKSIQIVSALEYAQLKRAFQGGFTHANALYSGDVNKEVASYDFTSSYPSVMIADLFPMGTGQVIQIKGKDDFERNLSLYACIFDVQFREIEETFLWDHYISFSKCWDVEDPVLDNGRIVKAKSLRTTITGVDFEIIRKTYKWKGMRIRNFRRYVRDYLPTDFVKAILKLYSDKTTLKGVAGSEKEYLNSKEQLNSCYGMSVTDIARESHSYIEGEWVTESPDLEKALGKYNNSPRRFLAYQWGVFVTAYARRNLWSAILTIGRDYIYSDTDSVKIRHAERYKDYFDDYDKNVLLKLRKAMEYHHLSFELVNPKSVDGKEHPLGVWDYEGTYKLFKTLGAKRYMVQDGKGEWSLTISGVNKKIAMPYLLKECSPGETPMDLFEDDLYFPPDATGKNLHTYIDYPQKGSFKDYLGNPGTYDERSSVHLEKTSYELTMTSTYLDFILGRKNL